MFRKTLVSRALSIAFGATALGLTYLPIATAQSNATGTIYGNVGSSGSSTVVIESIGTNARRTVTPDASGNFQATALPPGPYKLTLERGGAVVSTIRLEVLLGQGVEASFASAAVAGELQAVQVVGRRSTIDVKSTNSTTTFTASQLAQLPIAQNLTSILLLAPDTVKADPRYAGGASIGGGAPSENSYYINGFPVTNPLSQLGSIELPFGAIQQAQILTGGFGSEFGRSTGGVVNITTKSGTNTWQGGANAYIEPNALRAKAKNIFYPSTGEVYLRRDQSTKTETQYGAYIGGPLIKDKLFMFVAADKTTSHYGGVSETTGAPGYNGSAILGTQGSSTLGSNGWVDGRDVNTRYLGKIDWQITDDHRLEWTTLGDKYVTDQAAYGYDYSSGSRVGGSNYTVHYKNEANQTTGVGGSANILKYTGNLTQDLTLTALYGQSQSPHKEQFNPDIGGSIAGVNFSSTGNPKAPGVNYGTAQPLSAQTLDPASAKDKTRSFRIDVEYALGKHLLRAGLDQNKLSSTNAGQALAGGSLWTYFVSATPGTPRSFGPYDNILIANGTALGNAGYYVRQYKFSSVTDARSDQTAQYIEDRYQPIKDLLLTLGLRNESFTGYNGEGKKYIDSKNFISPRVGASWDVKGDSSLKVFGNLGRYSIQTPTHVAVRGAGVSTLTYQYFTYGGVDAFGRPTGLTPLIPAAYSPDGETGQPKDPNSVAAKDLKPSYQDELILGLEKSLARNLNVGAKMTYRRLGATLDDSCDDRPFYAYAAAHNIDTSNYSYACASINPGRDNKFLVDYSGTGKNYTPVTLTAADFGLDKPKRTFMALDFFAEHPFQDGWYGKIAYTWSKSKGNTEGQTKSDTGQTDVSATASWDFHEIMENAYGYLPSDRRHVIKAIGFYQMAQEWAVGASMSAASGRPKNCIGNYAGNSPDGDYESYGSAFFYCSGVPTPRGSQGRLPWDYSLDMNVAYSPLMVKGLKLRFDVFNLFNRQSALAISELHEQDGDAAQIRSTYGRVIGYSAPRVMRMTAQYDF